MDAYRRFDSLGHCGEATVSTLVARRVAGQPDTTDDTRVATVAAERARYSGAGECT
jgi:hypothetical protein